MPVNGRIKIANKLIHTSDLDLSTPIEIFENISYDIADGTSDDQMDLLWHDQRDVGTGGEELDLTDGTLIDAFGAGMNFAEVRLLIIQNTESGGNIIVGNATADPWFAPFAFSNDRLIIEPLGVFMLYTPKNPGYAVSAGSDDRLKIASSTGTITYNIWIGGVSA